MRIMLSSNAVWSTTGYGVEAKYLLPRLEAWGHEVAQFAWYGLQGGMLKAGFPIYPGLRDGFGADIVGAHCKHFGADLLVSLHDVWVLPPDYRQRFDAAWAVWMPVDHSPLPRLVRDRALPAEYPLVYSQWGTDVALDGGLEHARYMPLAVDTDLFYPGDDPAAARVEAREALGLPQDAWVVDMVAANKSQPSRKNLVECIDAFADIHALHPDAVLYLHTEMSPEGGGIDLWAAIDAVGLPRTAVRVVDQYHYLTGIKDDWMVKVYRAADVHLGPSVSEGFGLPLVEAQACGTPVITTHFSSMPELTWAGMMVEPSGRTFTPLNAFVASVTARDIYEALKAAYEWPDKTVNAKCEFAVNMAQAYSWDAVVAEHWVPFLAEVEGNLHD